MCAPSDDRQSGWRAGEHEQEEEGGEEAGLPCRLHRRSVKVRQGGYLLRWADSTNQYHAAQRPDERGSPGRGKVRKNFEKIPELLGKDEPRTAPRCCRQAKPPRNGN